MTARRRGVSALCGALPPQKKQCTTTTETRSGENNKPRVTETNNDRGLLLLYLREIVVAEAELYRTFW